MNICNYFVIYKDSQKQLYKYKHISIKLLVNFQFAGFVKSIEIVPSDLTNPAIFIFDNIFITGGEIG